MSTVPQLFREICNAARQIATFQHSMKEAGRYAAWCDKFLELEAQIKQTATRELAGHGIQDLEALAQELSLQVVMAQCQELRRHFGLESIAA